MTDRRVQNAALAVVLAALVFGGWGLYEVGKSRGIQQALRSTQQIAPASARGAAPHGPRAASAAPDGAAERELDTEDPAAGSGSDGDIVHATRTGKKYHRAGCRFLSKSDIPMGRSEAEAKGLTPCGVCQP
jgi:DNA-entry nuclease